VNPVVFASPQAPRLEPTEGPLAFAASDRLLLVAPHPDDESLAAGGLLQRAKRAGAELRVIYVTDGENNPWAQLVFEGRWPASVRDRRRWGARRRREAIHAVGQFGIEPGSVRFLGFPDQGLTDDLARGDEKLLHALSAELRATQPTVVAIPSLGDRHPDHSAIAVLALLAIDRGALHAPPPCVLRYLVHPPAQLEPGNAWVRLDTTEQVLKRRAILCHRSQLRWRRSQLLATVEVAEEFRTVAPVCPHDPMHPIQHARFEDRELVFELERVPRPALGPAVLRVLFETPRLSLVVATLPLASRRESIAPLESSRGGSCGEARLTFDAASGRGTLRLTTALRPQQAYLKLERPFGRRLGIYDGAGWRAVPVS
jgi:LmbE family N-acetylglucosaminyl deacetylase